MARKKSATNPAEVASLERSDAPRIANDVVPSSCKMCGSTERTEYSNTRQVELSGTCQVTGRVFTQVIWRDCTCLECGQKRCDRTPVFEGETAAA